MKITILKHFINDSIEYGEYYISYNGVETLIVQNGNDYKAIAHFRDRKVSECLVNIRKEVINAIKDKLNEVEE